MIFDIFGPQAGGNGPGRYVKSFLVSVAPSWLNMSPRRATGTSFMTNIIDLGMFLFVSGATGYFFVPLNMWNIWNVYIYIYLFRERDIYVGGL